MRSALQLLRRAPRLPRLRHQSTAAAQKTVDDAFLASLEALATTSQSPDVRKLHGDDESHHEAIPPEVVAFRESSHGFVRVAAAHRIKRCAGCAVDLACTQG